MLQFILRKILTVLFRVEIRGGEYLMNFPQRTVVVANHTSLLDALLLYAFLPVPATFAINTYIARSWVGKVAGLLTSLFPLDPTNPLSIRSLIRRVEEGGCVVIFPEGRITVTGSLMKVYQGPGLVAERSQATLMPIRIDGAQYTPFSYLKGRFRLTWFPKIRLHVLSPRHLVVDESIRGRARRERAGQLLTDLMADMMFETANQEQCLAERILDARHLHGGAHIIAEDVTRTRWTYNDLITRATVLGNQLAKHTEADHRVGVLLPSTLATVATFWGLQFQNRIPAMLNYTVGAQGMMSACETAQLRQVITSKKFVAQANLDVVVEELGKSVQLIYLEDIAKQITWIDKIRGMLVSRSDRMLVKQVQKDVNSPAVVLFTSGSEGTPKGVVLSHRNLVSNIHQLSSRIDFNGQDVALNALPLFHSFGLTAGMLLPITSGVKVFFYPSPLHYRIVPEIAYDINATILFGTNTFLAGYARFADPYDFFSLRYVFAGAEKLQEEVRRTWQDKFGVRIFEGYGATEASPVLAGNTPLANQPGSVGRLMPGVEYRLTPVPGLDAGQRLQVRGPNIMLGYLLHANPGVLVPPATELGQGWYDTGDIVTIDEQGFVRICGRAKRFAKVAGEMVSLTSVEVLATSTWPNALHAAIAIPDPKKGEQVVLLTTQLNPDRGELLVEGRKQGVSELAIPRQILQVSSIPVLGTGKTDYVAIQKLAGELL